ncbi:hypothetical protein ACQE3E_09635 [Methylomonas sp. MED-D]
MKKQPDLTRNPDELRRQAEQRLTTKPEIVPASPSDEKRLVHELQVHQIELEMLYENLRYAQDELEKSWASYFDLYDLAPVGYLTISDRDVILNANLTATSLLGVTRKALLKKLLTQFILDTDQDVYYLHRQQ